MQPIRQPGRAEQQEQILLGNAQLDMLPLRRHPPTLRAGQLAVAEHVVAGMPVEYPAPVHPRAKIGGHGHIRRGGHNPVRQIFQPALAAADFGQHFAKAGLRRAFPPGHVRGGQGRGNGDRRRGQRPAFRRKRAGERHPVQQCLHLCRVGRQPLELVPFMARANAHFGAEQFDLFLRHQPGMVILMPGERQPHAFDGVGDKAGRLVARRVGDAELLDHRIDVMPAEIVHQRRQIIVRERIDDRAHPGLPAQIGQQRLPPGGTALKGEGGIQ